MATNTGAFPRKADRLHAREIGDEIVVVDEVTQQAHVLRGDVADVWRALDGGRVAALGPREFDAAVRELQSLGLVHDGAVTRRDVLRRAGTIAVAGTVISIGLPTVDAAASGPQLKVPVLSFSAPVTKQNTTWKPVVTVIGPNTGDPVPTGTVTLTVSGNGMAATTKTPQTVGLANGQATFGVDNGNHSNGQTETVLLSATYTPDGPSSSTYSSSAPATRSYDLTSGNH